MMLTVLRVDAVATVGRGCCRDYIGRDGDSCKGRAAQSVIGKMRRAFWGSFWFGVKQDVWASQGTLI